MQHKGPQEGHGEQRMERKALNKQIYVWRDKMDVTQSAG